MKAVGSPVTIRLKWEGTFPAAGDWLQTRTGRTYEIERVRGNVCHCVVLPSDSHPPAGVRVHLFYWLSRVRK